MSELISVEGVSKSFILGDENVHALKNVGFKIDAGGIVALMGPSGSGKSTLLNMVGALDSPSSGEIKVQGRVVNSMSSDQRAEFRNETVGFIFQSFNLIPVLTTLENVILPSQLSFKTDIKKVRARARELLCQVGLEKQINQGVNRLSGGQMQRVSIARALINKPQLILADEPTANLDHDTSETVLDVMKELCMNESVTVVMATHDHFVLKYCDRIISLRDGVLTGDEIQTKP